MSRRRDAIVVVGLLAVLATVVCDPPKSWGADKRTTRELLQNLDRFFADEQALRCELVTRSDLLSTIAELLEQRRATPGMIWLLDEGPFERVEPALRKAIESEHRWVRSVACDVLGGLGDPRSVPILDQYLARCLAQPAPKRNTPRHEDDDAIDALESLACIEGPASDRVLQRVLGHPSSRLRFLAAQELARRGTESTVPVLIELLDCTQPANSSCLVRRIYEEARRALQQLTYVYDMSVYSDLDQDLKPVAPRGQAQGLTEKQAAVAAKWKAWWQAWWETHKSQTRSQWREESLAWSQAAMRREKSRDEAVERLLLIGDKKAIDLLFALVNDAKTPTDVQARAVLATWFLHNPLLEEPLRLVVQHHPSGKVRAAAAYALNGFRSKASGAVLLLALSDPETMNESLGSLRFYPYPEFLDTIRPFLKHADAEVRASAQIAVDAIRDEGSETRLLERLGKRPDAARTIGMVDSLRWRGREKALPQLVALSHHGNRRVRAAAITTMESIAKVQFDRAEGEDADRKTSAAIDRWWAERQRASQAKPRLPNSQ